MLENNTILKLEDETESEHYLDAVETIDSSINNEIETKIENEIHEFHSASSFCPLTDVGIYSQLIEARYMINKCDMTCKNDERKNTNKLKVGEITVKFNVEKQPKTGQVLSCPTTKKTCENAKPKLQSDANTKTKPKRASCAGGCGKITNQLKDQTNFSTTPSPLRSPGVTDKPPKIPAVAKKHTCGSSRKNAKQEKKCQYCNLLQSRCTCRKHDNTNKPEKPANIIVIPKNPIAPECSCGTTKKVKKKVEEKVEEPTKPPETKKTEKPKELPKIEEIEAEAAPPEAIIEPEEPQEEKQIDEEKIEPPPEEPIESDVISEKPDLIPVQEPIIIPEKVEPLYIEDEPEQIITEPSEKSEHVKTPSVSLAEESAEIENTKTPSLSIAEESVKIEETKTPSVSVAEESVEIEETKTPSISVAEESVKIEDTKTPSVSVAEESAKIEDTITPSLSVAEESAKIEDTKTPSVSVAEESAKVDDIKPPSVSVALESEKLGEQSEEVVEETPLSVAETQEEVVEISLQEPDISSIKEQMSVVSERETVEPSIHEAQEPSIEILEEGPKLRKCVPCKIPCQTCRIPRHTSPLQTKEQAVTYDKKLCHCCNIGTNTPEYLEKSEQWEENAKGKILICRGCWNSIRNNQRKVSSNIPANSRTGSRTKTHPYTCSRPSTANKIYDFQKKEGNLSCQNKRSLSSLTEKLNLTENQVSIRNCITCKSSRQPLGKGSSSNSITPNQNIETRPICTCHVAVNTNQIELIEKAQQCLKRPPISPIQSKKSRQNENGGTPEKNMIASYVARGASNSKNNSQQKFVIQTVLCQFPGYDIKKDWCLQTERSFADQSKSICSINYTNSTSSNSIDIPMQSEEIQVGPSCPSKCGETQTFVVTDIQNGRINYVCGPNVPGIRTKIAMNLNQIPSLEDALNSSSVDETDRCTSSNIKYEKSATDMGETSCKVLKKDKFVFITVAEVQTDACQPNYYIILTTPTDQGENSKKKKSFSAEFKRKSKEKSAESLMATEIPPKIKDSINRMKKQILSIDTLKSGELLDLFARKPELIQNITLIESSETSADVKLNNVSAKELKDTGCGPDNCTKRSRKFSLKEEQKKIPPKKFKTTGCGPDTCPKIAKQSTGRKEQNSCMDEAKLEKTKQTRETGCGPDTCPKIAREPTERKEQSSCMDGAELEENKQTTETGCGPDTCTKIAKQLTERKEQSSSMDEAKLEETKQTTETGCGPDTCPEIAKQSNDGREQSSSMDGAKLEETKQTTETGCGPDTCTKIAKKLTERKEQSSSMDEAKLEETKQTIETGCGPDTCGKTTGDQTLPKKDQSDISSGNRIDAGCGPDTCTKRAEQTIEIVKDTKDTKACGSGTLANLPSNLEKNGIQQNKTKSCGCGSETGLHIEQVIEISCSGNKTFSSTQTDPLVKMEEDSKEKPEFCEEGTCTNSCEKVEGADKISLEQNENKPTKQYICEACQPGESFDKPYGGGSGHDETISRDPCSCELEEDSLNKSFSTCNSEICSNITETEEILQSMRDEQGCSDNTCEKAAPVKEVEETIGGCADDSCPEKGGRLKEKESENLSIIIEDDEKVDSDACLDKTNLNTTDIRALEVAINRFDKSKPVFVQDE